MSRRKPKSPPKQQSEQSHCEARGGEIASFRPRLASMDMAPLPDPALRAVRESLRATDAYVRVLMDRLDLACDSDLVSLDGVPAAAFGQLTAVSDALQAGAHVTLSHLDPSLARSVRRVADLARESVGNEHSR